jgi:hypothetical protein
MICGLILILSGGCNNPAPKTTTIDELVGFDVEEFAQQHAWNYERKVSEKKKEILAEPRIIIMTTGQNLESALALMLQPPLAKIFIEHHNTITSISHSGDEQSVSNSPDDQTVNRWFEQSAATVCMGNGIKILDKFEMNSPIILLQTNLSSQQEVDPAVYFYEMSFEFKRALVDPTTGLSVLSTMWEASRATFLDKDLNGLKTFSTEFIDSQIQKLIRFEAERGLFKAALRQLKEENNVPKLYQPILSHYKDW